MSSKAQELFESIGEKLIAAIESGEEGQWSKPWKAIFGTGGLPTNAVTKKAYNGFNVMLLWIEKEANGFATDLWATYKQWQSIDAQVIKGQKGTQAIKWGVTYKCLDGCKNKKGGQYKGMQSCSVKAHANDKHVWSTTFTVFNASQVEGFELPNAPEPTDAPERLEAVEAFIEASGANVQHVAGDKAYFVPGTNNITLPLREQFDTVQGYYGTALHELTHWSGDKGRLDRANRNTFGSQGYAAEELVAEFGAAFLAGHFGIEVEPHIEHAKYLKSWASVIRSEPMALYRATKQAQEAATYLLGLSQAEAVAA